MFQNKTQKNILLSNQENIVNNCDYEKTNENLHDSIFCTNGDEFYKLNNSKISTDKYKKMISMNSQRKRNVKTKLNVNFTNNTNQLVPQELEIMNIFTSSEWLDKPVPKPIVNLNLMEEKEIQVNEESKTNNLVDTSKINNVTESNTYNNNLTEFDQEKSSIDENENISNTIIPLESFGSLELFLEEELHSEYNLDNLNVVNEKQEMLSDVLTSSSEKTSENIIFETFEEMDSIKNQEREFSDGKSYTEKTPENISVETLKYMDIFKDQKTEFFDVLSCSEKTPKHISSESSKYTDNTKNDISGSSEVFSCTEKPSKYTIFEAFKTSYTKNELKSQATSTISNKNVILENQQSEIENQPKITNSNEDNYRSEKQIRDECYSYRYTKKISFTAHNRIFY